MGLKDARDRLPLRLGRRPGLRALASVVLAAAMLALAPAAASAAVYTVTTSTDTTNPADGLLSLREAVEAASAAGGSHSIELTGGMYTVTGPELRVGAASPLALTVNGHSATIRRTAGIGRLFDVDPQQVGGVHLTLSEAVLEDGFTNDAWGGGAIVAGTGAAAADSLTLDQCSLIGNEARGGPGGAVAVGANTALTVTYCVFWDNAASAGGALFFATDTALLSVSSSYFFDNTADGGALTTGEGGAIYAGLGAVPGSRITGSTFTGNRAVSDGTHGDDVGGALFLGGTATVDYNHIARNTADRGAGCWGFGAGVDAKRNWWGTNDVIGTGTCAGIGTYLPNIVLRGTAVDHVYLGGSAAVTADISSDASGLPSPFPGSVPMTFTGLKGGVVPATGSWPSGNKQTVFTGSVPGTGGVVIRGDSAVHTVTIAVWTTPTVTVQPSDITVNEGAWASFTATASGFPTPTMQWQQSTDGGGNWADVSGATTQTVRLRPTIASDGYRYRARFGSIAGSATSDPATLTVRIPPTITQQPSSRTVLEGEEATFSVAASGYPSPTLKWQASANLGGSWSDLPGETSPLLSVTATRGMDALLYRAVATNAAGTATSFNAWLTVWVPPYVTTPPEDTTVIEGRTATFTVAGFGMPALGYQWQRSADGVDWVPMAGKTSPTLTFSAAFSDDASSYRCVLTNAAGTATSTAGVLTVHVPPAFTAQPSARTVLEGAVATFSVAASGYPVPTLQWQYSANLGASWAELPGETSPLLSMTATRGMDHRIYRAVATNAAGTVVSPGALLTVWVPPYVTAEPGDTTVIEGRTATFTVAGFGMPAPAYQWQKSDHGLPWADLPGKTTPTLSFTAPFSDDGSSYRCVLTNTAGTARSSGATLTVHVPPTFATQPVSRTLLEGAEATFSVETSGYPAPTVRWQASTNGGALWEDMPGMTSQLLSVSATRTFDGYLFRVIASNAAGVATSTAAQLTVWVPPYITSEPEDTTVIEGQTATFSVTGYALPAPAYRWQKSADGLTWDDVAGETSRTVSFTAAFTDNGSSYRCVLTNAAGGATSTAGVLTVHVPPTVVADPQPATVRAGLPATFTASGGGYPAPAMQWQRSDDGGGSWTDVPGATSGSLVFTTSAADDGARFRAEISNVAGTTYTASARLTADATAPVTIASGVPTGWANADVAVTLLASDGVGGSGVGAIWYRVPGGVPTPYSTPVTISAEGTSSLEFGSIDAVGNAEETRSVTPAIDKTMPEVSADATASYEGTAAIRVTATDALSGPSAILLVLDGLPAVVASGPVADVEVAAPGSHSLAFAAFDAAGNRSATQTADFAVFAQSAPVTTISTLPAGWVSRDVTFTLDAYDEGSPVAGTWYRLGSGVPEAYSGLVTVTAEGTTTIDYWSEDALGNAEATKHASVRIDRGDPVSGVSGVPASWVNTGVVLSFTATDTGAGISAIRCSVNGAAPLDVTGPVALSAEGTYSVAYSALDRAGNAEVTRTTEVRIDKTPPTAASDAVAAYVGSTRVSFAGTDTLSGIARFRASLDGGPWKDGVGFDVVTNGPHTLEFLSEDAAGNVSAVGTATFTLRTAYYGIGGTDRYASAVAASKAAFASGSATTVVLCSGATWPDAITGSSLAGAHRSPLLLTRPRALPATTAAELGRLGAERVVLLGGTGAVGAEVAAELTGMGIEVQRIGGADRYDTARLVAAEVVTLSEQAVPGYDGVVFVASGRAFPDALAAAPVAWARVRPILLSRADRAGWPPSALASLGVSEAVVLGGTGSVPASVEASLSAELGGHVSRIGGSDRYETAVNVAEYAVTQGLSWDGVALATGLSFPDALAGGVMQGRFRSPLLLTSPVRLSPMTEHALRTYGRDISDLRFLGAQGALPEAVRVQAAAAVGY